MNDGASRRPSGATVLALVLLATTGWSEDARPGVAGVRCGPGHRPGLGEAFLGADAAALGWAPAGAQPVQREVLVEYVCGETRLLLRVREAHVTAVHWSRRTRDPLAFEREKQALVARLGPPTERDSHRVRWATAAARIELAGGAGEYDLTLLRR